MVSPIIDKKYRAWMAARPSRRSRLIDLRGSRAMSSYQFHYLNPDQSLACLMQALCRNDEAAMKFAASLPDIAYRRLEIWRGETMIYERLNPRTLN
jgi:hypothetical protein